MVHQFVFKLGITCQGCLRKVHLALQKLDFLKFGLYNHRIDPIQKKLFIDFDSSRTEYNLKEVKKNIIGAIDHYGIQCEVDSIKKPKKSYHWTFGIIGLISGFGIMLLSIFTGGLSVLAMISIGIVSTALTITLGFQSFSNAYRSARFNQTLTMDSLFTISTLTVTGISFAAFFIPGLPMMFETGLMIFGFRHIGFGIEKIINKKSGVQRNFTDRIPKTALLKNGKRIEISQIQPGNEIILQNGDMLPVDGSFVDKHPTIQNTILTGNERRHKTKPNQIVNAGAIVSDKGQKYIFKAKKTVDRSYLAKLDNMLLSAQQSKAPVEYYTDKLLNHFIPSVFAVALLSGLIVGLFVSPILAIKCAATVLVIACPCTLGMIVPMTMKIGMQKGLKHGMAFQTREAIEHAANINQVAFDLNGTLTQGKPQIQKCEYKARIGKPNLIQIVHLLEKDAKHPIGICLAEYAKKQLFTRSPILLTNGGVINLINGRKTKIKINGLVKTYCIGNAQCMREQGISVEEKNKEPNIYLAENNHIIAKFIISDPIREGAIEAIKKLQQNGKSVYMLTGTDKETASFYGKQLDIPTSKLIVGESPEGKQKQIKKLQAKGSVAMIGDGGNDALAMQQSDLAIAIHSPLSDIISTQQAQVLINDQSIFLINHIFEISKQTMLTLKLNLWFSFAYNATALLLTGGILAAIGIAINPALGAGLMVIQTSIILLNTYRLSHQPISALIDNANTKNKLPRLDTSPINHPKILDIQELNTLKKEKEPFTRHSAVL